jgi:hypothetical protein
LTLSVHRVRLGGAHDCEPLILPATMRTAKHPGRRFLISGGPERYKGEGCEMAVDGVQTLIPGALSAEELRIERRRAYTELGILKMERDGRSVMVGKRRTKAWRCPGTPEFEQHARLVAQVAAAFSGDV